MQPRQATIEGIPMRWLEHGSGVPVVMVHGIPTGPELFRRVAPLVPGRSLAWEMVGYGGSIPQARGRDISVARQADYLLAWIDAVARRPVVMVGHDLGGGVVQIAAERRPDRCAGLVLTNAICYDSWPIPSVKAMRSAGRLVERLPLPVFKAVLSTFLRRGHDDRRVASESIEVHLDHYARHGGAAAFVRQIRSLDVRDTLAVADRLPSLEVPARIVWGAADRFQKLDYGERLARDLGAPLDRIEGGRHFIPEDHPHRIAAAIEGLLETPGVRRRTA